MRTLTSLVADLKIVNSQPANRKNRRARAALSRRIIRRLAKRAKHAQANG
ncbi:MAG: hypothetical protein BroJett011_03830 [Chloroflexota bacterium]|nr:MAG: hypothetical protein BroJett011_03830 [Chloroflexota bacterium]